MIANAAGAVLAAVVMLCAAFPADAAPRTYYDVAAHKWVTYDPDKLRSDATGAPAASAPGTATAMVVHQYPKPDKKFDRQIVNYDGTEEPGTVIVDTKDKFLYYVQDGGKALRMGVGVGREGFGWTGTVEIGAKSEEWPSWTPPAEMIERRPELVEYSNGMPGGPDNPLGARAMYLFDNGRDTMFRIHGTNEPWSIGGNVSSGCIRMLNEHVSELYQMVTVGTKVIVM
jgi:lipoprotein-anchoring transpeptidase ErfK/SrfK